MEQKIGFIGLGEMGKWMSLNLVKAGYDVSVCDINSCCSHIPDRPGGQIIFNTLRSWQARSTGFF